MPMCICDNTHIDTINDISSLLLKGVSVFWGITPSSLFLNIIIGDLQPNMILKINLHWEEDHFQTKVLTILLYSRFIDYFQSPTQITQRKEKYNLQ